MIIDTLKKILPDRFKQQLSGILYGWHGDYATWQEAENNCQGYNTPDILNKVKSSALKVKEGSAVYERDSFLFNEVQYSYPLLSSLMWIAALNSGKLNVLDFGGSLGSTYYQNKKFLNEIAAVNWCVVEQPDFVKTGNDHFSDDILHFYNSVEECQQSFNIDVVLFSSVLQYISEPYKLIDQINSPGIKYIIIDRTPFIEGKDRITVQRVNPKIYKGSYPCWFFNKEKFLTNFLTDYELILEFDALDKANISSEFKGFLFRRRAEGDKKINLLPIGSE